MNTASVAGPDDDEQESLPRKLPWNLWICLALILATLAVYGQSAHFEFVNFDDSGDALNAHMRQGLRPSTALWALYATSESNWLPLTRLSHLLDYSLFGGAGGPRHLENALQHMLASLLVFWFLLKATGERWPSAFVAFLFAVHPLHVESVEWIAERKDTLSGLFWFLTLTVWVGYARRPSRSRYLSALALFALALMAKPMAVTLPAILLLLDYWPLNRAFTLRNVLEKAPFAVLSLGDAAMTLIAQRRGGAVTSLHIIGPALRIENALVSWLLYPAKTIWPSRLAVWYPYPSEIAWWIAGTCALILLAISAAAIMLRKRAPWLLTGWGWYLVTTLPVIGILQVGMQARADRYAYIPMVGLAIPVAWGAAELTSRRPSFRLPIACAAGLALCCCTALAFVQAGYWRNSELLFGHAVDVTDSNYVAWQNFGSALARKGDNARAVTAFQTAVRFRPEEPGPHLSLCGALPEKNEALQECDIALQLDPDNWESHNNRGATLKALGRTDEAIEEFRKAVRSKSSEVTGHQNLAAMLYSRAAYAEALAEDEAALKINPDLSAAHFNKGRILMDTGKPGPAAEEFEATLRIEPDSAVAHGYLATALDAQGRTAEALDQMQTAARLDPAGPWRQKIGALEEKAGHPR